MAKLKKINSMLNNLIESYFSTLNCWGGTTNVDKKVRYGYATDWLWKLGIENNLWDITIDILNNKCSPQNFEVGAILSYLSKLQEIIGKCLVDAGVEKDFAKEVKFFIQLRRAEDAIKKSKDIPTVICTAELIGPNQKFKSKEYTHISYDLENLMG